MQKLRPMYELHEDQCIPCLPANNGDEEVSMECLPNEWREEERRYEDQREDSRGEHTRSSLDFSTFLPYKLIFFPFLLVSHFMRSH